jgi:hypothetical protein
MRNVLFILAIIVLFSACRLTDYSDREITVDVLSNPQSENAPDSADLPIIDFDTTYVNFGVLSEGEKLNYKFPFVNAGKSPLILSFVEGSCGCTVMKNWPKKPMASGEKSEIEVEFNSRGKSGFQSIAIRVVANTRPATTVLMLEGDVVTPD